MTRLSAVLLLTVFGGFSGLAQTDYKSTNNTGFRKHIQFNHLFVVVDESTYANLFDQLKLPKEFAWTSEQTMNAGSTSWTGKYIMGVNNYVEIFKAGSLKGSKVGDCGVGFTTNKLGTLDSLHTYWANTLDSVHVDHTTTNDNGKITPWFTSVSIPNVDSLKLTAWVFENAKEDMTYAGFTDQELAREISYSDYDRHITAKVRNVPLDSVKSNKLFDKITSVSLSLSQKELAYLSKTLRAIGFTRKSHSFLKDDFRITYGLTESAHILVKEIEFLLAAPVPKKTYSSGKVELLVEGKKAKMSFKYE